MSEPGPSHPYLSPEETQCDLAMQFQPIVSEVGTIARTRGEAQLVWTIPDVFSNACVEDAYFSPVFTFSGSSWCLNLVPSYMAVGKAERFIALYLVKKSSGPPVHLQFTFGLWAQDGSLVKRVDLDCKAVLNAYGVDEFLELSQLPIQTDFLRYGRYFKISLTLRQSFSGSSSRMDTLSEDFEREFVTGMNSDLTLNVANRLFRVHNFILQARCPLLASLCKFDLRNSESRMVFINDWDPDAFKDFLLYLYSGRIEDMSVTKAFYLYEIATKFMVDHLKSLCVAHMKRNLEVEIVCRIAMLAEQYGDATLAQATQKFFNDNFARVLLTDSWAELEKKHSLLANRMLTTMADSDDFDTAM